MTDLDLIPTEDLLKALQRRYDHMVFAGINTGIKKMGGTRARASASAPPTVRSSLDRDGVAAADLTLDVVALRFEELLRG